MNGVRQMKRRNESRHCRRAGSDGIRSEAAVPRPATRVEHIARDILNAAFVLVPVHSRADRRQPQRLGSFVLRVRLGNPFASKRHVGILPARHLQRRTEVDGKSGGRVGRGLGLPALHSIHWLAPEAAGSLQAECVLRVRRSIRSLVARTTRWPRNSTPPSMRLTTQRLVESLADRSPFASTSNRNDGPKAAAEGHKLQADLSAKHHSHSAPSYGFSRSAAQSKPCVAIQRTAVTAESANFGERIQDFDCSMSASRTDCTTCDDRASGCEVASFAGRGEVFVAAGARWIESCPLKPELRTGLRRNDLNRLTFFVRGDVAADKLLVAGKARKNFDVGAGDDARFDRSLHDLVAVDAKTE